MESAPQPADATLLRLFGPPAPATRPAPAVLATAALWRRALREVLAAVDQHQDRFWRRGTGAIPPGYSPRKHLGAWRVSPRGAGAGTAHPPPGASFVAIEPPPLRAWIARAAPGNVTTVLAAWRDAGVLVASGRGDLTRPVRAGDTVRRMVVLYVPLPSEAWLQGGLGSGSIGPPGRDLVTSSAAGAFLLPPAPPVPPPRAAPRLTPRMLPDGSWTVE